MQINQYAPIIIPTLNRFQHFKECVESLRNCTHADKTDLIIGLDYPPSEKYVEGWMQIKEYIPTIKGFNKIIVFERDKNYGAALNANELIKYVKEVYFAYIFTEDDNVFSPCFLDYMDKCLTLYKDDKSIFAVCGYISPHQWYKKDNTIMKLDGVFNAWGYATWIDRQEEMAKNIPDGYQQIICSNRKYMKLLYKKHITDLYHIFVWANNPFLNCCCDYTIRIHMKLENKKSIYPTLSLVCNKGHDGSGINCGYLEDDFVSRQPISRLSVYDIQDTLAARENFINTKIWLDNETLSDEQMKITKSLFRKYMFFGYKNVQMFEMLKIKFKTRLKQTFLFKLYKRIR